MISLLLLVFVLIRLLFWWLILKKVVYVNWVNYCVNRYNLKWVFGNLDIYYNWFCFFCFIYFINYLPKSIIVYNLGVFDLLIYLFFINFFYLLLDIFYLLLHLLDLFYFFYLDLIYNRLILN